MHSTDETLRNYINVYESSFPFVVRYGCFTVRSAKPLLIGLDKYFCVWNKCQGFEKKKLFDKKFCFCPFLLTDFSENNDGIEFFRQLRRYYWIHSQDLPPSTRPFVFVSESISIIYYTSPLQKYLTSLWDTKLSLSPVNSLGYRYHSDVGRFKH